MIKLPTIEMTVDGLLEVGAFYWVIPTLDPDTDNEWERGLQPARYAGDGKWNALGIEGDSDWPMRYVGNKIEVPVR